jgi:soluble lytic murein transglycosylase
VLARRIAQILLALLLLALAGEISVIYWRAHQPKENPYDPIIVTVAREDGVDPYLVRALIWRESKFDSMTLGSAQERGLMQVTPAVGSAWAKANHVPNFQTDDLYNPWVNVRAGTWYLSHAIQHWDATDDPTTYALAEYNAGRSNALKWVDPNDPTNHNAFLERITFPTTRRYVETILTMREQYLSQLTHNKWYRDDASAVTLSR